MLAYIVAGVRYELVPPPPEYAPALLNETRAFFTPPRDLLSRLIRPRMTCSTVTLSSSGHLTVWDAVCWSSGERAGVELYRVTPWDRPPTPVPTASHPRG